jgi:TRAP-type C4-dicarboxylate transport system substrate-binding protein
MIRSLCLVLCLILPGVAAAQTAKPSNAASVTWVMPNEYPASSIHGEGDRYFADELKKKSRGRIVITHQFEAESGLLSRDMLDAVGSGKVAIADLFGGAAGEQEPVFLLPSLPFLAVTTEQARALFESAQATYERVLAKHNQKLLYPSPWPPSGIWAKRPIMTQESLKGLRIRTYDANGTATFKALGAAPEQISFTEAVKRLTSGEIQAVLSSGDGGAGARLWDYLDHFTAINYAMPLSLVTINLDVWKQLTPALQRAVRDAASATETRQWTAIRARVDANYARMRANLVTVTPAAPPELTAALKEAGKVALDSWLAQVGAEGRVLLADYERRIR